MPRRHFEAIQKYFHCFNRRAILKGNTNKLMILRPVLNCIIKKCCTVYVPLRNLSIDEGMLKWKGRLSIHVYNPLKPIKYGLKFYFFVRSKIKCILDCIIYRGVTSTLRDIVFTLLGRHLGHGYHVFMDNYCNSVSLAEELLWKSNCVSGMLRLPRGASQSLQNIQSNRNLSHWELAYWRKDNTLVFFFMPLPLIFTPLPMIQTYINLLPSSASLPLMLDLNLVLLCLQLLTQICRAFPSGEPVI